MQSRMIAGMTLAGLLWLSHSAAIAGSLKPYGNEGAAPQLELEDLDGRTHNLADLRGSVVLVNFWASWCPPCLREIPSMQRLADSLQGRPFRILAVNVAEGKDIARRFLRRMNRGFTVLLDKDGAAFKAWQGRVLPTSYLVDAEGQFRYLAEGPLDWDSLDIVAKIEQLFPEK